LNAQDVKTWTRVNIRIAQIALYLFNHAIHLNVIGIGNSRFKTQVFYFMSLA
jgi:hypothetical protein